MARTTTQRKRAAWARLTVWATIGILSAVTPARLAANTSPSSRPASAPAKDVSTPQGSMAAMVQAIHDADPKAIRKFLYAPSPLEEKLSDATAREWAATGALWKALTERFGADAPNELSFYHRPADFRIYDGATWTVDGDEAVSAPARGRRPLRLRRSQGVWQTRVVAIKNPSERQLRGMIAKATHAAEAGDRIAAAVRAGRYQTLKDVVDEINSWIKVGSGDAR